MSAEIHNFGCRLNIAEGEAIAEATRDQNDLIVINSCAVTAEATRQARQAVRRAARERPDARIVVTGCAAQVEPLKFARLPGVTAVLGNREKRMPDAWAALADANPIARIQRRHDTVGAPSRVSPIDASEPFTPVLSGATHARAFIEVQTGCDHRCTFCIIPYGRGDSRSAPLSKVLKAVATALDRGQQEVVLTGVDLSGYAGGLAPLVSAILHAFPALPRLRLSSIDPVDLDADLIAQFGQHERLLPHVHLSLQSGNDLILKRMKRRHNRAGAVAAVAALKRVRPEVAIGADLIAGFPTEDEAMALDSLSMIDDCELVFGHIFSYSPRVGTPAARMPQTDPLVARRRAARLREAVAGAHRAWLTTMRGSVQPVLIERDGRSGHTPTFARVVIDPAPVWGEEFAEATSLAGRIIPVRITAAQHDRLTGVPLPRTDAPAASPTLSARLMA